MSIHPADPYFKSSVSESTAPLQGLRVLFCYSIVVGHVVICLALALNSPQPVKAMIDTTNFLSAFPLNLIDFGFKNGVDVFMLISGFMMARKFHYSFPYGNNSFVVRLKYALHYLFFRWLRLVPLFFLVSMLFTVASAPGCPKWSELFFVRDSSTDVTEMCIGPGWSTIVDYQIHIVIAFMAVLLTDESALCRMMCIILVSVAVTQVCLVLSTGYVFTERFRGVLVLHEMLTEKAKRSLTQGLQITRGAYEPSPEKVAAARRMLRVAFAPPFVTVMRTPSVMTGFLIHRELQSAGRVYRAIQSRPNQSLALASVLVALTNISRSYRTPDRSNFELVFAALKAGIRTPSALLGIGIIILLTCSPQDNGKQTGIEQQKSLTSRILQAAIGNRIMVLIAQLSYSIYLSHFLVLISHVLVGPPVTDETFTLKVLGQKGLTCFAFAALFSVPLVAIEKVMLRGRTFLMRKSCSWFLLSQRRAPVDQRSGSLKAD